MRDLIAVLVEQIRRQLVRVAIVAVRKRLDAAILYPVACVPYVRDEVCLLHVLLEGVLIFELDRLQRCCFLLLVLDIVGGLLLCRYNARLHISGISGLLGGNGGVAFGRHGVRRV